MTVASDIADFLVTDLQRSFNGEVLGAINVFKGQENRVNPAQINVQIKWRKRDVPVTKTGIKRRYEYRLNVGSNLLDDVQEQVISDRVLELCDRIVERYDGQYGGLAIFKAGITTRVFERVRAQRGEAMISQKGRVWRESPVTIEIDVWE